MRHPMQRYIIIMLIVTLLPGLWNLAGPTRQALADSTVAPAISASPGTLQTGGAAAIKAVVTVTGQGFSSGETITLSLNGRVLATTPSPLVAAGDGSFNGTFLVPNLTVRAYPLVAVGQSSGISANIIFWLRAPNENVYSPLSGQDSYQITGKHPREPQMYYLRITNTGDANLVNPKVLPDSLPGQDPVVDTSSMQSIVNGVFAANPNAVTDAQKTFALWQWVTDYTYHYYDPQNPNVTNQLDVIGMLNNYGFARCENQARLLADLFQAAGYQARTWNLNGHAEPEVYYDNAWHMYDADEEKYFVGPDGSTVLGVQDLESNPQPVFLDTNAAGVALHYPATQMANFYLTTADNKPLGNIYPPAPHNSGLTLRKNETLMEYWNKISKYHNNTSYAAPPVSTNGDIVYTPDLSQSSYQNGVFNQTNVSSFSQDGLQPNIHSQIPGTTTSLVYQFQSPYVLVGSVLSAQTYLATSNDSLSIYFSLDGTNWGNPVYTQTKLGYDNPTLDLSAYLNNRILPEEYQYYVMFQWTANSAANGAGLNSFNLDSQFEQAWESIPPLHSGTTTIAYSDQSNGANPYPPGTVQIAYGWKSQGAPANLVGSTLAADYTSIPANGATFANVTLRLRTLSGTKIPYQYVQLIPNAGANVQIQRMYQYQGLRGQTDNNGQAIFEVRSQQAGTVTLTAADKNGVSLGLPPLTLTFITPPPPTTLSSSEGPTIVNGNFATGDLTGWTAGGAVAPTVESSIVPNGTYAAQLGATSPSGTPEDSSLLETISVPAKAKSLTLTYWFSNPNADSTNYFEIWMQDTAGDRVYRLFSAYVDSGGWKTLTLSYFDKYQGNTVQILFNLHQDGSSNPAYAYLDNVQIN